MEYMLYSALAAQRESKQETRGRGVGLNLSGFSRDVK